ALGASWLPTEALCLHFASIMDPTNKKGSVHASAVASIGQRGCIRSDRALGDSGQRVAMTSPGSGLRAAVLGMAFTALAGLASAQEAWHTMTGPEQTFTADLPATPKYTEGQA